MNPGPLARSIIAIVRGYQLALSPYFGQQCRFTPSCSQYMIDAVRRHGALSGFWQGTHRICRCHPWSAGGYDPVK